MGWRLKASHHLRLGDREACHQRSHRRLVRKMLRLPLPRRDFFLHGMAYLQADPRRVFVIVQGLEYSGKVLLPSDLPQRLKRR